jgi:hypothetical protein
MAFPSILHLIGNNWKDSESRDRYSDEFDLIALKKKNQFVTGVDRVVATVNQTKLLTRLFRVNPDAGISRFSCFLVMMIGSIVNDRVHKSMNLPGNDPAVVEH